MLDIIAPLISIAVLVVGRLCFERLFVRKNDQPLAMHRADVTINVGSGVVSARCFLRSITRECSENDVVVDRYLFEAIREVSR